MAGDKSRKRIAFFLPDLTIGGVEKVVLRLAAGFLEQGFVVDLVLARRKGELLVEVPAGINIISLSATPSWCNRIRVMKAASGQKRSLLKPVVLPIRTPRILCYFSSLANYLSATEPDVLVAAMSYANITAVLARRSARSKVRLVLSEHSTLSRAIESKHSKWRWRYLPQAIGDLYPDAGQIIAVSDGVADDLSRTAGLPRQQIRTVYNPVTGAEIEILQQESPAHEWLANKTTPVVVAVGRMMAVKGFDVLIRAFARLRQQRQVRLLILGEGGERQALEALAKKLGVTDDVSMPGFVDNPFSYMANADLFVLSSRYEGLGNVLIEALACGCPVVSTDCPSGPREILDNGKYGPLVPVGDDMALAEAMEEVLGHAPDPVCLRRRAERFSIKESVANYRAVCFPESITR